MQRQRVRLAANISRNDRDRAEFPHHARIAQHDAIEQRPLDIGQRDGEEGAPAARAKRRRSLFEITPLRLHERNEFARHEGCGDEHAGEHNARQRKQDLDLHRLQRMAEQALEAEDEEIGHARDDRRDRERDLDDDSQQSLARKIVFGDRPSRRHAESCVDGHGDQRRDYRQHDGMAGIGIGDGGPEISNALRKGLDADDDERRDDHQPDKNEDECEERAPEERMVAHARRLAFSMMRHGQPLTV